MTLTLANEVYNEVQNRFNNKSIENNMIYCNNLFTIQQNNDESALAYTTPHTTCRGMSV